MPDSRPVIRDWVAFDLDAARIALEHWERPQDRAGWLHGYHAGASGGVLWPRATQAEADGFGTGQIALWDAQAKKKEVSERNRARVRKRWSNRQPPPEPP